MKKLKSIFIPADEWACGQLRIIQPARELNRVYNSDTHEFKIYLPKPHEQVDLNQFAQFDVIYMQRITEESTLNFALQLKKRGKIIIMDIDDDLINVEPSNPFYKIMEHKLKTTGIDYKKIFGEALKIANYVTVTTDEITNLYAKEYGIDRKKFIKYENVLDLRHPLHSMENSKRKFFPQDKVIFGWQGGSSHLNDLQLIKNVERILDDNDNAVFAFCSNHVLWQTTYGKMKPKYKARCIFLPPITKHYDFFPNLPSVFDIGLAPVTDHKFNRAKSWLKCLEYGIFGTPTICSPMPDYERFNQVTNGGNLIVKSNDIKEWHKKTNLLIQNESLRKKMGQKSRDIILNELNLQKMTDKRFKLFQDIYNGK